MTSPSDGLPDDHDDSLVGEPWDLLIPDDISALEADIEALRRERQAARRGRLVQRFSGRLEGRVPAILITATVLLVAMSACLLVLLAPRGVQPTGLSSAALAHPTTAPGKVGGLLPSISLQTDATGHVASRALPRPAGLILVPTACGCASTVQYAVEATAGFGLHPIVVTRTPADAALKFAIGEVSPTVLIDADGALSSAYGSDRGLPTLVVVRPDGAVSFVQQRLTVSSPLAAALGSVDS